MKIQYAFIMTLSTHSTRIIGQIETRLEVRNCPHYKVNSILLTNMLNDV